MTAQGDAELEYRRMRRRSQLNSQRSIRGDGTNFEPLPSMTYKHAGPCACGCPLSIYNPNDICGSCENAKWRGRVLG